MNEQDFKNILNGLLSPQNNVRQEAENVFNQFKQGNVNSTVEMLLGVVCALNELKGIRILSLVLLWQIIRAKDLWSSVQCKQKVMEKLVFLLQNESDESFVRKTVHAIVSFPKEELVHMSELMDWCLTSIESTPDKRYVLLFLLSKLAEFAFDLVNSRITHVIKVLGFCLDQQDDITLQVSAGEALCFIALSHKHPQDLRPFLEKGVPVVVDAIGRSFEPNVDQRAHDQSLRTLESLSSLTQKCVFAFENVDTVTKLLRIAQTEDLDDESRVLALVLFEDIFSKRGKQISADSNLMKNILGLILQLQCQDIEFEDEFQDQSVQIVKGDILMLFENGMRAAALNLLKVMASKAQSSETFVSLVLDFVSPFFSNDKSSAQQQWKEKHAAISMLGAVIEPSHKVFKAKPLRSILELIAPLFQPNQHPMVTFFALGALYEIMENLMDDAGDVHGKNKNVSEQDKGQVVQLLIGILTASNYTIGVKCAACQCLAQFLSQNDLEQDDKVIDTILTTLAGILNMGSQDGKVNNLQQECMLALGKLASSVGAKFEKHYDDLVPGIKMIIADQQMQSTLEMKSAAMLCMVAIAEACGHEKFLNDARQILDYLLNANPDDVLNLAGIFDFLKGSCGVLENDFVPYLPKLLPIIYKGVKADVNLQYENVLNDDSTSGGATANDQKEVTITQNIYGHGMVKVSANIHAFQLRIGALDCLDVIIDSLGASFGPFLDEAVQNVVPLISDHANIFASTKAAECSSSILYAAVQSLAEQGHSMEPAVKLFVAIVVPMLTELEHACDSSQDDDRFSNVEEESDGNMEHRIGLGSAVERVMRVCFLSGGEIDESGKQPEALVVPPVDLTKHIVTILRDCWMTSIVRRTKYSRALSDQGYDRESILDFMEEFNASEEGFSQDMIDAIGFLLKIHKSNFVEIFNDVLESKLAKYLEYDETIVQCNALCLYIDYMEFIGDKYVNFTLRQMIKLFDTSTENPIMMRVLVYGLGIVGMKYPQTLAQSNLMDQAVQMLGKIVEQGRNEDIEDCEVIFENALSALGKICFHNNLNNTNKQLREFWLSHLPITEDVEEAIYSHKLLFELLQHNQFASDEYPTVLRTLADILLYSMQNKDTTIVDKKSKNQIPHVVKDLLGKLNGGQKQQLAQMLDPQQSHLLDAFV